MAQCKCYISHGRLGDVEEIVQCPLCEAAPDLLAACRDALKKLNWPIYTKTETLTLKPCKERLEVAIIKAEK